VTEASARIVAAVSAEASSTAQPQSVCGGELCCATTVDNNYGFSSLIERDEYPTYAQDSNGAWYALYHYRIM